MSRSAPGSCGPGGPKRPSGEPRPGEHEYQPVAQKRRRKRPSPRAGRSASSTRRAGRRPGPRLCQLSRTGRTPGERCPRGRRAEAPPSQNAKAIRAAAPTSFQFFSDMFVPPPYLFPYLSVFPIPGLIRRTFGPSLPNLAQSIDPARFVKSGVFTLSHGEIPRTQVRGFQLS